MHTFKTTYGGHEAHVHHNSDFSGMAHVNWTDADGFHEVHVPAVVLVAGARRVLAYECGDALPTKITEPVDAKLEEAERRAVR